MKHLLILLLLISTAAYLPAGGNREQPQEPQNGSEEVQEKEDFALLQGVDLFDGAHIGAEIFQDNSVTLINIWATTCPACIRKMPELARLEHMLPEQTALIGIALDGASRRDDALAVLESHELGFTNIVPHGSMSSLLHRVAPYIPATVLVDSTGKIISGPHYGLKPAEAYLEEIESHL